MSTATWLDSSDNTCCRDDSFFDHHVLSEESAAVRDGEDSNASFSHRRSGQKTEGDSHCYPSTIKEQVLRMASP